MDYLEIRYAKYKSLETTRVGTDTERGVRSAMYKPGHLSSSSLTRQALFVQQA
jgi:hypothetical protein